MEVFDLADVWGSLSLKVQAYRRPGAKTYLVEKELLGAYDAHQTGTPNSVLMGTGRRRKTREIEGWATRQEYAQLVNDFKNAKLRTVTFSDGFSMTARIWKLEGKEKQGSDLVWYTAVFIEG